MNQYLCSLSNFLYFALGWIKLMLQHALLRLYGDGQSLQKHGLCNTMNTRQCLGTLKSTLDCSTSFAFQQGDSFLLHLSSFQHEVLRRSFFLPCLLPSFFYSNVLFKQMGSLNDTSVISTGKQNWQVFRKLTCRRGKKLQIISLTGFQNIIWYLL